MKQLLVIGYLLLNLHYGSAQNITNAEYFFDIDPGPGNATPITGFSANDTLSISTTISTSGLNLGFHFLAVRVKDANNRWSHFEKRGFYIHAAPIAMPDLVAAEYFFDQDPGPGNATSVSIGMTNDSLSFVAMIPQSLAGGFHTLAIRVKDQNGRWSLFEKRTFYVSPAPVAMPNIAAAEYFIGADPGAGNGTPISTGIPDDTISHPFTIPIPPSTPLGTYFYTIRVKDVTGKWSHFKYDTVIVAISVPEDTIVNATPGLCSKVVNGIDAQVINSEPYSYALTGATTGSGSGSASGLSFNAGITTITYTLDNFPTAFASFTVTVVDTEIPTITCPANITVGADSGICGAVVNYTVVFDDNCPGDALTLLSGLASGSAFPAGPTINTFRVTDTSGNSMTCSFTVTVVDDVPPVLTCPANVTVNTDPGLCSASNVLLGTPGVSDNCALASTTNNGLTVYPLGTTQVTWTSTDVNGNTTTCIQTVTVVDNQNPVITCPANITMNADPGTCTKAVTYAASATDNCSVSGIAYNPISGSTFSVGTTVVTATATDVNGRTSSCTFTVTIVDSEDPVITCPANITVNAAFSICTANVSFSASATDNCGTPTILYSPASGSTFPVGTTIVTATATDAGGRTATCTFSLTVLDDQPPSISCPANITVNTDSGLCTATGVSLGSPVVSDNCGIAMTSNNGLSIYSVGVTNILWTTTDVHGLMATCMQTVTVVDNQNPVITNCPQNIVTTADPGECSAVVNFSFAGTDNCGLQSIVSSPFQSGEGIPVGTHIITILATDINGNTSTCTFTVVITDDESPQITCPAQINEYTDPGNCNGIVTFNFLTSDNCFPSPSILSNPVSGSAFPVGSTIVTSTATDMSGNSQSCTFVVTIADEEPPTIDCPAPVTINTDMDLCTASGVSLGTPFTDDNCGVASTTNNGLNAYPLGVTNVTWTVTDIHGRTASCVQTVTVVDNQTPQIICPADMNVFAGPGPTTIVNYDAPIISDNCPFVNMIQTAGLPSGSAFPIGNTVNIFVATDASGNSSSCSFTVNVRIGRVGVNTTNPLAILHVADSSVLFSGVLPLPIPAPPPPASGPGIRTMWYPAKGAFRTGRAASTEWDQDSIGLFSFAAGESVKAKGDYSIALGYQNNAANSAAVTFGSNNNALAENAIALGALNNSVGNSSTSLGYNNIAQGAWSTSMGANNIAAGNTSLCAGFNNQSLGTYSAVFGKNNYGNAYTSFTIGQYCDTLVATRNSWSNNDPLFIIGNGSSNTSRRNALMLLKNGNTGLNTSSPSFRLHVTNDNPNDGGYAEGIMIENTDVSSGEAAISFRNKDVPGNRQWMLGLNQAPPHLAFAYGAFFAVSNTHMVIDTSGYVGINVSNPQAPLHIIRSQPSGGALFPSLLAAFESNTISYLHLSSMTSNETGVISGNQSTLHRSGMLFTADSSIHFTTGGDNLHLKINKNGNVGINTSSPSARLEVNGSSRLGAAGSSLQEVIKVTVNINVPSISNNATHAELVSINDVVMGSTVFVSEESMLPDGLIIASARVSSTDQVEIRFINKSGGAVDPAAMNYYIAIIR